MVDGMQLAISACEASGIEGDAFEGALSTLLFDGGVDTEGLTFRDLRDGLLDDNAADWRALSFGLDELLASYAALDGAAANWTIKTTLSAYVALIVMAHSARRGNEDVSFLFDKVCKVLYNTRFHLTIRNRVELMQYFLACIDSEELEG